MTCSTGIKTLLFSAAFAVALPAGAALAQDQQQREGERTHITGQDRDTARGQDRDREREQRQTVITGQERDRAAMNRDRMDRDGFEYEHRDPQQLTTTWYKERARAYHFQKELDRLAIERAQNPQIRQFAQRNIERGEQEMQRFQEDAGRWQVRLDSEEQLSRSQQARLEELRQYEGEDFDRAYVFETHTNQFRINLYDGYAQRFQDRDYEGMRATADRSRRGGMERQREIDAILIVFADPEDRARLAGEQMDGNRDGHPRGHYDRDSDGLGVHGDRTQRDRMEQERRDRDRDRDPDRDPDRTRGTGGGTGDGR